MLGDKEKAKTTFERALKLNPLLPNPALELALFVTGLKPIVIISVISVHLKQNLECAWIMARDSFGAC